MVELGFKVIFGTIGVLACLAMGVVGIFAVLFVLGLLKQGLLAIPTGETNYQSAEEMQANTNKMIETFFLFVILSILVGALIS